jgi:hypothetical protein
MDLGCSKDGDSSDDEPDSEKLPHGVYLEEEGRE